MKERDYDHRSVVDKLGVKPEHVVIFAEEGQDIDLWLRQEILARTARAVAAPAEVADLIFVMMDQALDAVEILQRWKPHLKPSGCIWLLTPKRHRPEYIDQRELIAAGKVSGMVDNKVCSISADVSAMRFVIPRKHRPM